MKALILEDENGVAQNLCDILQEIEPDIEIVAIIETVKDAIKHERTVYSSRHKTVPASVTFS